MRPGVIKGAVPDIEGIEQDAENAPEAFGDVIPLMIPAPTYAALSRVAAVQNKTVAELIAYALERVITEG